MIRLKNRHKIHINFSKAPKFKSCNRFRWNYNKVIRRSIKWRNDLTMPPTQAKFIYRTAFMTTISVAVAVNQGHYMLALGPAGVFFTSLNYWRYPVRDSWRRYFDIVYVICSVTYHYYKAIMHQAECLHLYLFLKTLSLLFYPCSWYVRCQCPHLNTYFCRSFYPTKLWLSTLLHMMMHIVGNIAIIVLYISNIIL